MQDEPCRSAGTQPRRTAALPANSVIPFCEAHVPTEKMFFNDLLPRHDLKGEAEYRVIGDDYRVSVSDL